MLGNTSKQVDIYGSAYPKEIIVIADLLILVRDRLTDAETLPTAQGYDGAVYSAGYAVEIALKYRICKMLNWAAFAATSREFDKYKSF